MGIPENIKTRMPDTSENSTTEYLQPSGINQCVKKRTILPCLLYLHKPRDKNMICTMLFNI